jgi:ribosomal protein S18 acetylase RimI-like enzyme
VEILRAYTRHLSLIVGLFDEYRRRFSQPPDLGASRVFLADRPEKRDSAIFFASEGSGSFQRALGFMQLDPTFSSLPLQRIWILSDLYVIPGCRRHGVARALHERARQLAVETRASGITLAAGRENSVAQRLCEALGYQREEKERHFYLSLDTE